MVNAQREIKLLPLLLETKQRKKKEKEKEKEKEKVYAKDNFHLHKAFEICLIHKLPMSSKQFDQPEFNRKPDSGCSQHQGIIIIFQNGNKIPVTLNTE